MADPQVSNDDRDEQLATLLTELSEAAQQGGEVDIEEVCRQHPQLSGELRDLWGAVMLAGAAADSSRMDSDSPAAPSKSGSTLKLPYRCGDYELLQEIGAGGMGAVYRARQISLNRTVAVKMLLEGSATVAGRRRFRAEAEAAAGLDHPNIVPVYEVDEFDGRLFFSMKLIEGQTLAERLRSGPMPPREAAALLAEVARAVHVAHQQGVLHRDLKPSNILIDHGGRPHVSDFGLAKLADADAISLTRSGAVLGTPAYMAPEQAAGNRGEVGPASDVYSLGTILYHMITGRPPFLADQPVDVVLMVLEQDPPLPRRVNPAVNRDLEMIAMRCLQKPPDLRYPTAESLAEDLQAYLKDEPISARAGRLGQVVAQVFRETHHAPVLENWGALWMWHSLALFCVCLVTNVMYWSGDTNRLHYVALWTVALWGWAGIFWVLRRRMGPVLFVERQIAHVWAASMIAIAGLFPLEYWLGEPVLKLSPVLGLITSMVFVIKAGMLSGAFYLQGLALLLTSAAMVRWPHVAHLIFGTVSAACFFFPGLKYYRRSRRRR